MKDNNLKTPPTDWARIDATSDEEIDLSDSPELGEDFFANAEVVNPPKENLWLQLSPATMARIKSLASERHTTETAIATEWLEEKAALAA